MIENLGANPVRYVQVGWTVSSTGLFQDFTQSLTGDPPTGGGREAPSNGNNNPTFRAEKVSGGVYYYRDGLLFDSVNVPNGYQGCVADSLTELLSLANQEPGGTTDHEAFTAAQVKRQTTGSYTYMNGSTYNDEYLTWGNQPKTSSAFDVWDSACLL